MHSVWLCVILYKLFKFSTLIGMEEWESNLEVANAKGILSEWQTEGDLMK